MVVGVREERFQSRTILEEPDRPERGDTRQTHKQSSVAKLVPSAIKVAEALVNPHRTRQYAHRLDLIRSSAFPGPAYLGILRVKMR